MEATEAGDELFSGADVEVVGVAEDDLRTEGSEFLRCHGLDGCLRADRHEDWGLHRSAPGVDGGGTGAPLSALDREMTAQTKNQGLGAAPAMASEMVTVSETLSRLSPGLMSNSLRLKLNVVRTTRRSPWTWPPERSPSRPGR